MSHTFVCEKMALFEEALECVRLSMHLHSVDSTPTCTNTLRRDDWPICRQCLLDTHSWQSSNCNSSCVWTHCVESLNGEASLESLHGDSSLESLAGSYEIWRPPSAFIEPILIQSSLPFHLCTGIYSEKCEHRL